MLRKKTIVKPSAVAEPHPTFAAAKQWRDKQVDVLRRHPIGGIQRLQNPADGGLGRVTLLPSVKLQTTDRQPAGMRRASPAESRLTSVVSDRIRIRVADSWPPCGSLPRFPVWNASAHDLRRLLGAQY